MEHWDLTGPHEAESCYFYAGYYLISCPDGNDCLIPVFDGAETVAHLVTAAPDLLDALECIVANADLGPDSAMSDLADCYYVPLDDIEAARAAITKAREDHGPPANEP